MSDFVSGFWSFFVIAIVVGGLVFCAFVLFANASVKLEQTTEKTTGHVWDETLAELNNPLPRWWMGLFVITIVFSIAYLILYPGLGSAKGVLGWSAVGQLEAEQAKANEALKPVYAKYSGMTVEQMAADSAAMGIGERIFLNNCAGCHGSDARGSKSFPNLTDNDWLGGDGGFDYILKTVTEGRQGMMPVMAAAVGSPEDVKNVANYVLSLSGSAHNGIAAQLGKSKFGACAACHGQDGKGNPAVGAPNLTDKIWLHGWGEEAVIAMVNNGKTNIMPAQNTRLTPEQIRMVSAYVWSLSHKKGATTAMSTVQ